MLIVIKMDTLFALANYLTQKEELKKNAERNKE